MSKPDPETPFVHTRGKITPELVAEFANAPQAQQLAALSSLRSIVAFDGLNVLLSGFALVIAFLAIGISTPSPKHSIPELLGFPQTELSPWADAIFNAPGFVTLIVFGFGGFIFYTVLQDVRRRQRAVQWLRAYEDELVRRWNAQGRKAKRWRTERPILWHQP